MARAKQTVAKAVNSLPAGQRLLVAVSGGIDSVVLLHSLLHATSKRFDLGVAHVDHSLRAESKSEALFVEKLAREAKLPFHLITLTAPKKGNNIEDWARRERYKFFAAVRESEGYSATATAHHANDVAETLLMRLLSNKELSSIEAIDLQRALVRPFLHVSREEILEYANEHALQYVEDRSNRDERFLRNRVRHRLLPFLEEHFESMPVLSLAYRAAAVADDVKCLYALSDAAFERVRSHEFGSKNWLTSLKAELKLLPTAVQWRLVERLLKAKLGFNVGRAHSRSTVRLINNEIQALELPSGQRLSRTSGKLLLEERRER